MKSVRGLRKDFGGGISNSRIGTCVVQFISSLDDGCGSCLPVINTIVDAISTDLLGLVTSAIASYSSIVVLRNICVLYPLVHRQLTRRDEPVAEIAGGHKLRSSSPCRTPSLALHGARYEEMVRFISIGCNR